MPHSSKQNLIAYHQGHRNKDEYRHMRALRRAAQAPQQGPGTVTTANTTAAITRPIRVPDRPQRPIPTQAEPEPRTTKRKAYQKGASIGALLDRELSDSDSEAAKQSESATHDASDVARAALTNHQLLPQYCLCSPDCPGPHAHPTAAAQHPAAFNQQTRSQPCPCSPYCPGPHMHATMAAPALASFGQQTRSQPCPCSPYCAGPHMHDQRFGPVPGPPPYFDPRSPSIAPSQPTLPPPHLAPLQQTPSTQAIGNTPATPAAGVPLNPVTGLPFNKTPSERMLKDAQDLAAVNGVTSPDKRPGQPRLQPRRRPFNFDPNVARPLLCPICRFGFVSRAHIRSHFPSCVHANGNPRGLRWDHA